ncbi:MAG TPA: sulfotransferase [Myxococcota bacterium]|nr:sulfotransferase [Myxococcota bacterium]
MSRAPGSERALGEQLVLAFVLSASHSGSTLLSLLLNAHSQMHALSEIDKLSRYVRDPQRGRRPLESPFWRAVRARYEAASGRSFAQIELRRPRRASADALEAIARDYRALALAVAIVSGKRILIDASKDAGQLELLLNAARLELRVIQLLRDGRGVVHSFRRKYGSFARGYRHWSRSVRAAARLRERAPETPWLSLRYEDLARAPERELRRVCEFLGVAFEPAMLHFRRAPWEGIAGNRIASREDEAIQLDERWRQDLPRPHRALFHLLGSRLNARNGY